MTFIWPWVLVSLLLVPLCALLYRRVLQGRQRDALRLGASGLARDLETRPLGWRRHLPPGLFLLGVALLLVAAARPQVTLAIPRLEGIVMLVFDASASMAADDSDPTRIIAAQTIAQTFVERKPGNVKIGVVAFSDGGLLVQPATDDSSAVAATIGSLVPQSGTSLGRGILAALHAISSAIDDNEGGDDGDARSAPRGSFAPAVIVLLSDGENTAPPDPLEAAQTAIERGVRVFTVGIGSAAGTTLEIDGFSVYTQLNEPILKEIAMITEGEYFSVENADDSRAVYDGLDKQFVVESEKREITSVLGGVSMLVLIIAGALSLVWFGRVP